MREEFVSRNVARMVRVKTPQYEVGKGLDPVAARTFLKEIRGDELYALYLCAVVLGMRRGELLGLTWAAVDLEAQKLDVRQNLVVINGRLHVQEPKTRHSRRVIPLPGLVVEALRDHRERQSVQLGRSVDPTDHVFTRRSGEPISPRVLANRWHAVRRRTGLPYLRFHDLRHTCVSLLLAMQVPPHVVREIAGHSDVKVTMTVYAHGRLDEQAAALDRLGSTLVEPLGPEGEASQDHGDHGC